MNIREYPEFSNSENIDLYKSKIFLNQEGALHIRCKVVSNNFESIEYGYSNRGDLKRAKFEALSACLIQCVYSHKAKKKGDSYPFITIIDYYCVYKKYDGIFKYKTINIKGKRYLQVYKKNFDGKYVFHSRTRFKTSGLKADLITKTDNLGYKTNLKLK